MDREAQLAAAAAVRHHAPREVPGALRAARRVRRLQPLASGPPDAPPALVPYTYKKGPVNADFVPGVTRLTKYNAASGALSEADTAKGAAGTTAAIDPNMPSRLRTEVYGVLAGLCRKPV